MAVSRHVRSLFPGLIKVHHFMTAVMPTYNGYKPGVRLVITLFLAPILGFPVVGTGLSKVASVSGPHREVLIYRRIFSNFHFIGTRLLILLSSMGDMALAEKARGDNVGEIKLGGALQPRMSKIGVNSHIHLFHSIWKVG